MALTDNEKNGRASALLPDQPGDSAPEKPAGNQGDAGAVRFPAMASAAGPLRNIDGRTRGARAYRRTRFELTQALGGVDAVTPQQAIAIRVLAEADALRRALFADATAGVPVDAGAYSSLAAVTLRALKLIGMTRRAKRVASLAEIAAEAEGRSSA